MSERWSRAAEASRAERGFAERKPGCRDAASAAQNREGRATSQSENT